MAFTVNIDPLFMLWRSKATILSMLEKRGYSVTKNTDYREFIIESQKYNTLEELKQSMTLTFNKKSNRDSKITVFWMASYNLGTDPLKYIKQKMEETKINKAITIIRGKVTSFAQAAIKNLKSTKIYIEYFTEKELQIDISKHSFVPEHIVLSSKEKKEVLKQYNTTESQLPQIKITDPMIRYLGASRGKLIKIIRTKDIQTPEGTIISKTIFYRIVT